MLEVITWRYLPDVPDDDETVLLHHPGQSEPVWLGYRDAERWFSVDGTLLLDSEVIGWAHMPTGVVRDD